MGVIFPRPNGPIDIDCKTVGFFLKGSKEIGKAWRKSLTRAKRASLIRPTGSPVSLSVFTLVQELLFDYSRLLEYAEIGTVLQSTMTENDFLFSCK